MALTEHLYWYASNVHGHEWAIDYLESADSNWTAEEIGFMDWVFNTPVPKNPAAWMALNEGLTYACNAEQRAPYEQKSMTFIDRITDFLSKKMVRKIKNRYGIEIWLWDRAGFKKVQMK